MEPNSTAPAMSPEEQEIESTVREKVTALLNEMLIGTVKKSYTAYQQFGIGTMIVYAGRPKEAPEDAKDVISLGLLFTGTASDEDVKELHALFDKWKAKQKGDVVDHNAKTSNPQPKEE